MVANKKVIINPKNDKCSCCFAYSIIVALNPTGIKDWKKFEKNNEIIALNILQIPHNEKNITHVYKSKHNNTRKYQVVLLMNTDGEKWHYTTLKSEQAEDRFILNIKSLSRLFKGITSNHKGDFYCLNCLHSFRTYDSLKKHEKLCEDNDFCKIDMPDKKK